MTPRELARAALRREPIERIPALPQISHDAAVRIYAAEDGRDWLEGMQVCMEQPFASYEYTIRLARDIGCDGLRLWPRPDPVAIRRSGETLLALDLRTGERIGRVDSHGGGFVVLDMRRPPVETLQEAKQRLDQFVAALNEDRLGELARARQMVPDLFVTSACSVGMDLYRELRGGERALMDLVDRPGFVRAVMDIQAEAIVAYCEKLLCADIDSLVLGDASSSSSLISPRHFESICLPSYQAVCRVLSNKTLVHLHICGKANPILELMAESGADVLEPLDPLGAVSVADAKRRVGDRVALLGGVSGLTLIRESPEGVRDEAVRKCREGGPHGYALAAGDMVPADTPLQNLRAMVEVARESLWKE